MSAFFKIPSLVIYEADDMPSSHRLMQNKSGTIQQLKYCLGSHNYLIPPLLDKHRCRREAPGSLTWFTAEPHALHSKKAGGLQAKTAEC